MNIGILTYHTGYNYGASLQAYALQTTVEKMGHSVEIINFETERFLASREMFSRKPTRLKEIIKIISRLGYYTPLKKRQSMFDDYTTNCLHISPLYKIEKEVIENVEKYDCIICGSDQIWNLSQEDDPASNPIFFLNFPKKQKRISYAASFGNWIKEADINEEIFIPWLKKFDAISVREVSGVDYVRSKGLDCTLTLDPTLLLDKEEYEKISRQCLIPNDYILMFGWNVNSELIRTAKKTSKYFSLPVYNIVPPPRGMFSGIKRKLDIGPREFLGMVKNASFVVTNSFHGTAFSVIMERPFISLHSGKTDLRMLSLLEQLGLSHNLVMENEVDFNIHLNTDYRNVIGKKILLRKDSLEYLRKNLGGM